MEPTTMMMMSQNFQFIQACLRSCVVCIGDALEESRRRQRHVAVVVVVEFFLDSHRDVFRLGVREYFVQLSWKSVRDG